MDVLQYRDFIDLVGKYKIFPFSSFIPEYPSLSASAVHNEWHTDSDNDPWSWRIKIVQDGIAAYGKFFGDKACFIDKKLFPAVQTVLTNNKTVGERYYDGLISGTALQLYKVISEHENIDSRELRKLSGLHAKEDKKEYDKALVELQNNGDIVITGSAKSSENDAGWNSMCFISSNGWLRTVIGEYNYLSVEEAKSELVEQLSRNCTDKSMKYFAKKLNLSLT
ncbi:MAG: hypothetical protein NAG76_17765 [Candidatus Pristimantibacillus lignocellulolyticus]|uniref:Uncharacterized protein n=1 Tax=Candidatus Pristimantibacillus lignocellulolyticus TaxID=2994561 RepID=A0A9J6ZCK1_9BACL|nr:MAG: hypothetical protein NAG76_17765 [Candidatus Pristimantibacillus lignocellulolyticus]